MAGRAKSKSSKLLANNPGKRVIAQPIKPPPGVPSMPPALATVAREEWERVVPILDSMGVLSVLDRAALADYCQCVARVVQIEAMIDKRGSRIQGRNRSDGFVKNPLFAVVRQYRASLQRWCDLFGFAPGPRGRLDVPEKPDEDPDGLLD